MDKTPLRSTLRVKIRGPVFSTLEEPRKGVARVVGPRCSLGRPLVAIAGGGWRGDAGSWDAS